ncbi:MAG: hypothetical protein EPN37_13340 [Chitinophagaceae bacterium]|nr:MAG: hypothetical protein EPN37_13340 [Chitinophagaceae bacterium]
MELQIDIGFDQLVQLAKKLPPKQWTKLKQEVDKRQSARRSPDDLETFLLNAPTFSNYQLDEIAKTRKAINQCRTK